MLIVETALIPNKDLIKEVPLDNIIKVYKTFQELEHLCGLENGIGISAVQVGIPWNLFLVKGDGTCPIIPKGRFGYFFNCSYRQDDDFKDTTISLEGCLSIKDSDGNSRLFQVERFKKVILNGLKLNNENLEIEKVIDLPIMHSQQGIVFQHEIDHSLGLEGLISNKGKEVFIW